MPVLLVLLLLFTLGYYKQNIIGVLFALSLVGFSVFAMENEGLADRINVILTLVLTNVALKFATADSLPKVSYNTQLDVFFLL